MTHPLILVADDEPRIRELVAEHLRAAGFAVREACDGKAALELFHTLSVKPDLVLLDLMMPEMDGHEALARLRETTDVPVIILTARDLFDDKRRTFTTGADDYLVKPFSLPELELRIRALLRRSRHGADRCEDTRISTGDFLLDADRCRIEWRGNSTALTGRELRLLTPLASRPGSVVRYEELLRAGWPDDPYADTSHLRVAIARLRKKIAGLGLSPRVLSSYSSVGYLLGDLSNYDDDYGDESDD